ncbi:MAG: hypothetical protein ABFD18_15650 [Syntrophomonas sp.]
MEDDLGDLQLFLVLNMETSGVAVRSLTIHLLPDWHKGGAIYEGTSAI